MSTTGDAGRLPSIATTNISLRAIVDADKRLDELSTARVIGEAAEAIHKLQKNGQALGTLTPLAIVVSSAGVRVDPPNGPTTAYSAPEKLRGQTGDRRSDVFALGIVLWEALAHAPLFEAATEDATKKAVLEKEIRPPSELNANVPAELDAICKKALARDPADRYQSAKVMAAEISAVLDDANYPDNNEQIAKYLEQTFPAGAPKAKTPLPGANLAAKLAATPGGSGPAKAPLNQTTLGMAPIKETEPPKAEVRSAADSVVPLTKKKEETNKTVMMGSLASTDLLPPAAPTEIKEDSTKKIGAAPVTPAPAAPSAAVTPAPSAPIVATSAPAGKRNTGSKPVVSIASAETVSTPALVPTATSTKQTDTPTASKVAGLPAMPPGASTDDNATKPEPILKSSTPVEAAPAETKPAEAKAPTPRPSQPAVDPRDAVSLAKRAKSETGEMLGGWGWSENHEPVADGVYEDDVDEEKVRRKRLVMAIGGALGVIGLVVIIALAAGGGGEKKPVEDKAPVSETTSRTAPEPTPSPAPVPATEPAQPAVEPAVGSGSAQVAAVDPIDPEAAKAEALAAENAAKVEAERLAKEQADKDTASKAEEARLAKEAAEKDTLAKAETARLAKEQAEKDAAAKAEEARLAKEAAEKAKVETARLAKEEAAKTKAAKAEEARLAKEQAAKDKAAAKVAKANEPKVETPKKKTEPKKTEPKKTTVAAGPKPVDPYAESQPKQDPATAYKLGFQQYVRGDTAGALATFKGSLAGSPSYAPTHRGLGLVYEKMGNKAQAKSSFRRYLQLSPKASDADQIRERMEKL